VFQESDQELPERATGATAGKGAFAAGLFGGEGHSGSTVDNTKAKALANQRRNGKAGPARVPETGGFATKCFFFGTLTMHGAGARKIE
jgi:hypothetical protein